MEFRIRAKDFTNPAGGLMTKPKFLIVLAVWLAAATSAAASPLAAVGVLGRGTSGGCSATLIEADVVLTAAHCVTGAVGDPSVLVFRSGAYPGMPRREFAVADLSFHPFYLLRLDSQVARLRFDMALVRLAEPVDSDTILPLPLGTAPEVGESLFLASYRGGRGERARERRCDVFEGPRELVGLGCEVQGGESGAPVLRMGQDGLEVVAVVSSRSKIMEQPIAFAVVLEPRIKPVFDGLTAGRTPDP